MCYLFILYYFGLRCKINLYFVSFYRVLDQLLGTTYFHERHLQSLVERLKHRGRVNSIQHMADQIFRLFSASEANCESNEAQSKEEVNMECDKDINVTDSKVEIDILIDSPVGDAPILNNASNCNEDTAIRKPLLSPVSPTSANGSEPRNLCQQLCAILKSRLLKAHEDAELRFGMSRSETSALLAAESELQNGDLTNETDESEPSKLLQSSENKENDSEKQSLPSAEEEIPEINSVGQGTSSFFLICNIVFLCGIFNKIVLFEFGLKLEASFIKAFMYFFFLCF